MGVRVNVPGPMGNADGEGNNAPGHNGAAERSSRRLRRGAGQSEGSQRFFRFVIIPALLLVALGIVGFVAYKPVVRRIKEAKSEKVILDARAAMQAKDVLEAHRKVQLALQLAPQRLPVQRLAAEFYTSVGQPDSLYHWDQVRTAPGVSLEDRLAYVDACLRFQRTDLALDELNRLEPTQSRMPEFLRRVVRYLIAIEDYLAAVPYARDATSLSPKDEELEYLLGLSLLKCGRPDWTLEGRGLLLSIALAAGTQQIRAAELLQSTGRLPLAEARQISRALERRPSLTFSERLVMTSLRLGSDAAERDRLVSEFAEQTPPSTDDEREAYARWALRSAVPTAAYRFLAKFNTTNRTLVNLRLEACALALDWKAMDQHLASEKDLADPVLERCLSAWRASQTGDSAKAEAGYKAALDRALQTPNRNAAPSFWTIATWAERSRLPQSTINALEPLLADRAQLAQAARAILRVAEDVDRYAPAYPAIRSLRHYSSNEGFILRFYAYLALLLGNDLRDAATISERLSAEPGADSFARLLAAFAKTRLGRPQEALELVERIGIDEKQLDRASKILLAGVYQEAGRREAARRLAREVLGEKLKAEERALLERIE